MVVIAGMTIIYELKFKRLKDSNKELFQKNQELDKIAKRLITNGENLVIDYDTLVNIARERFTDEELNELFNKRRKEFVNKYAKEKDERLYKKTKIAIDKRKI